MIGASRDANYRCQGKVAVPGKGFFTECGLLPGHEGRCEWRPECTRCGVTELEYLQGRTQVDYAALGYGPEENLCATCWSDHVESLPEPVVCMACGCYIDPIDVVDVDVDYVCIDCE